MNRMFYTKLACTNIRRNAKTYVPYILTCVFTTAMFYIIFSLSQNKGIQEMLGGSTIIMTLSLGSIVTAIFAIIFLFYTNSFLMKRRKREFGLFNILGMEKKHLAHVIILETAIIACVAMIGGISIGILLDKLMYLAIIKFIGSDITLGFYVSRSAILATIMLFSFIFLLIFLNSLRQIHLAKPIELLHSEAAGEKEPKARWILALLGVACLGSGYYISITTKNPVEALLYFFVAVILVILGTYLIFTTGSVALLKMLRKNKRYYYQTSHFINISGMIYRMKQNAVGLANICILITMVLVMISSTSSLMLGMEDMIDSRHPTDMDITVHAIDSISDIKNNQEIQAVKQKTQEVVVSSGLTQRNIVEQTYLEFSSIKNHNNFEIREFNKDDVIDDVVSLFFITLDDYNAATNKSEVLNDHEVMLFSNRESFNENQMNIFNETFHITKQLLDFPIAGIMQAYIYPTFYIVVDNDETFTWLRKQQEEVYGKDASQFNYRYTFDISGSDNEKKAFGYDVFESCEELEYPVSVESKELSRVDFMSMYGGFFFIGIFLGTLFVMATILIIYYKQISEGYDDKTRFEIMKKVGMGHTEVKRSIHSQILMVFFLPLVTAGIHVAFAYPVIEQILRMLNLVNSTLFIWSTVGCFIAFTIIYGMIYTLTAKTYYRIVSK